MVRLAWGPGALAPWVLFLSACQEGPALQALRPFLAVGVALEAEEVLPESRGPDAEAAGPSAPASGRPQAPPGPAPSATPLVGGGGVGGPAMPLASPAPPPPVPIATGEGVVVAMTLAGTQAIAGASVATADGRATTTAADGSFRIPAGNATFLVASAPGMVTSLVSDPGPGPWTIHLVPDRTSVPGAGAFARFQVQGQVVDPSGQPISGAVVVLEEAQSELAVPAVSDADGRFTWEVRSPSGRVQAGVVLGHVGSDQGTWRLGMRSGLNFGPGDALDLGGPGGALVLRPSEAFVSVQRGLGAPTGELSWNLVGPDGVRLNLGNGPGPHPWRKPDSGFRYEAMHTWRSLDGRDSGVGRTAVTQDLSPGQSSTLTVPTLPQVDLNAIAWPPIAADATLAWPAVAGAELYLVRAGLSDDQVAWEGLVRQPEVRLLAFPNLGPGTRGVRVSAVKGLNLAARDLMSLGPKGLRSFPDPESSAWSTSSREAPGP